MNILYLNETNTVHLSGVYVHYIKVGSKCVLVMFVQMKYSSTSMAVNSGKECLSINMQLMVVYLFAPSSPNCPSCVQSNCNFIHRNNANLDNPNQPEWRALLCSQLHCPACDYYGH